jgi:hypothetical protein
MAIAILGFQAVFLSFVAIHLFIVATDGGAWLKSKNPLSEAVRREREEEWR